MHIYCECWYWCIDTSPINTGSFLTPLSYVKVLPNLRKQLLLVLFGFPEGPGPSVCCTAFSPPLSIHKASISWTQICSAEMSARGAKRQDKEMLQKHVTETFHRHSCSVCTQPEDRPDLLHTPIHTIMPTSMPTPMPTSMRTFAHQWSHQQCPHECP